jgi:hypothetical protein
MEISGPGAERIPGAGGMSKTRRDGRAFCRSIPARAGDQCSRPEAHRASHRFIPARAGTNEYPEIAPRLTNGRLTVTRTSSWHWWATGHHTLARLDPQPLAARRHTRVASSGMGARTSRGIRARGQSVPSKLARNFASPGAHPRIRSRPLGVCRTSGTDISASRPRKAQKAEKSSNQRCS